MMSLYTIGRKDDKISSLMQMNKELLEEDHFKDVTLVSDDLHVVKAHRALLSKSSDVLRQILLLKDDKDPIIFIRGSTREQLKSLLNFIYLGETEVTEEDMNTFVQLAKDFKVKEFTDTKTKKELAGIIENIEPKSKENSSSIDGKVNEIEKELGYNDNMNWKEETVNEKIQEVGEVNENEMSEDDIDIDIDFYDPDASSLPTEAYKNIQEDNGRKMQDTEKIIKQEVKSHEIDGRIECKDTDCEKIFTTSYNMKVHYRVSHEGFSLKCDICGYKTTRTNIMRKHKQNYH